MPSKDCSANPVEECRTVPKEVERRECATIPKQVILLHIPLVLQHFITKILSSHITIVLNNYCITKLCMAGVWRGGDPCMPGECEGEL